MGCYSTKSSQQSDPTPHPHIDVEAASQPEDQTACIARIAASPQSFFVKRDNRLCFKRPLPPPHPATLPPPSPSRNDPL